MVARLRIGQTRLTHGHVLLEEPAPVPLQLHIFGGMPTL
jgi:hypothetical protein